MLPVNGVIYAHRKIENTADKKKSLSYLFY